MELSLEQKHLIELAKEGKNVLVDAYIGSGKTTTIQTLCNEIVKLNRVASSDLLGWSG